MADSRFRIENFWDQRCRAIQVSRVSSSLSGVTFHVQLMGWPSPWIPGGCCISSYWEGSGCRTLRFRVKVVYLPAIIWFVTFLRRKEKNTGTALNVHLFIITIIIVADEDLLNSLFVWWFSVVTLFKSCEWIARWYNLTWVRYSKYE